MSIRSLFVLSCSAVVCTALAPGAAAKVDASERATSCVSAQRTLAANSRTNAMKTFDDFIQDTAGPDICGENVVTNDNEGTITVGLHIHNRNAFAANEAYGVFFDTDLDATTGPAGADYRIRVSGPAVELAKWDGTAYVSQSTLPPAEWLAGYGPVFQLNAADLGGAASFGFFFVATDGVSVDFAPNSGAWSYRMAPLTLGIRALTVDRARPGKSFSARMTVLRSDFDVPLEEGAISCSAKVGTKTLAGTGRFAGGRAVCTWRLPKNTLRKRVTGTVTVTFQGVEAKRSFAKIVR
jgi:hypothetical protein